MRIETARRLRDGTEVVSAATPAIAGLYRNLANTFREEILATPKQYVTVYDLL